MTGLVEKWLAAGVETWRKKLSAFPFAAFQSVQQPDSALVVCAQPHLILIHEDRLDKIVYCHNKDTKNPYKT